MPTGSEFPSPADESSGPLSFRVGEPSRRRRPLRRVVVTGVAGFIGPVVRERLIQRGVDVVGIDRVDQERYPLTGASRSGVDVVGDLVDLDELDDVVGQADAIVHLAGTPGVQTSWATGFDQHVRNNVVATQRLCESALRVGGRKIVVASSSSVYGNVANGRVREDQPLTPLSPYGASKAAMEHLVGAYVARGLAVTPMRFFTVYGPGQRPDMAIHRMFRAALGGSTFPQRGAGDQARSFTFVDDVAEAVCRAVERDLPRGVPVNVGGDFVEDVRGLLARIGRIAGHEVPVELVPGAPGDPARTSADASRAQQLLDWAPSTELDDGLAAQWRWHVALAEGQADGTTSSRSVPTRR
ncbi:MAG: NAD(P)-dependent oxidoreductase [Actinomycetota bacterium]